MGEGLRVPSQRTFAGAGTPYGVNLDASPGPLGAYELPLDPLLSESVWTQASKYRAPINLARIVSDPDTLLAPDSLLYFASRSIADAGVTEAVTSGDREPADDAHQNILRHVRDAAFAQVFAPEQAASEARAVNYVNASQLLVGLRETAVGYADLLVALYGDTGPGSVMQQIDTVALDALEVLTRLQSALEYDAGLDATALHDAQALIYAADLYTVLREQATHAAAERLRLGEGGVNKAQQLQTSARERESGLRRSIDQKLSRPNPADLPNTAVSVQLRGQTTLDDHWDSCEADWTSHEVALMGVTANARMLVHEGLSVHQSINAANNTVSNLRPSNELAAQVRKAVGVIGDVVLGTVPARALTELLEQLRVTFGHLRRDAILADLCQTEAIAQVETVNQLLRAMEQLPLFKPITHSSG